MPSDRRWSDTDRELVRPHVACGLWWCAGEESCPDCAAAVAAVLDALTAAGWRRHNLPDITEAAIAYVDAPEGSDEVAQRWYELKGAVEHWRAVEARPTGGTDE